MSRNYFNLSKLAPVTAMSASPVDRRGFIRAAVGIGALAAASPLVAACGEKGSSGSTSGGAVTLGSYQSDEVPRKAMQEMIEAFKAKGGPKVDINTIDHETFKGQISNYLQGSGDDVFTWFAGYRARFFADQGLVGDLTDVIAKIDGLPDSMKEAVTASDGKQYLVPQTYYPWALFYKKSVWKERGYEVPKNWEEFLALGKKMKADGLHPVAFANKDGWEAMGTFDQLDLRINGIEFHRSLLAGETDWTAPEVKNVFTKWNDLLQISQPDSLGRTWQEAAQSLVRGESGMYLMGMFIAQQFPDEVDDYDFFPFPEIDPKFGIDYVEAPVDGFMMRANPKNAEGSKQLLEFLGSPESVDIWSSHDSSTIAANEKANHENYNHLQQKAVEMISAAKGLTSFLDRDTRPDFASTVISPSFQEYVKNPDAIDSILNSIQQQKVSIFGK